MTAVEKFHFGVEKCFIHTFQLAHVQERHEMQEVQKKITLLDETFTRSLTHLYEFCSFFVFACMFILS